MNRIRRYMKNENVIQKPTKILKIRLNEQTNQEDSISNSGTKILRPFVEEEFPRFPNWLNYSKKAFKFNFAKNTSNSKLENTNNTFFENCKGESNNVICKNGHVLFHNKEHRCVEKKFQNLDIDNKSNIDSCSNTDSSNEFVFDETFLINSLKNDKRVKYYKVMDNLVFVHFWKVAEAIAFYTQYFSYANIRFCHKYDIKRAESGYDVFSRHYFVPWRDVEPNNNFDYSNFTEDSLQILFQFNNSNSNKILVEEIINREITNEDKTRKILFDSKIEHYTNLAKIFSSHEVKILQSQIEIGINDFVFKNTKELAVGMYTNVIMQNALKKFNQNQIKEIILNMGYDIGAISSTKYGAYVVQVILDLIESQELKELIIRFMGEHGDLLIIHPIGNYSIQKIIGFNHNFVLNVFLSNFSDIVNNQLGLRVFKKCLEHFKSNYDEIYNALQKNISVINDEIFDQLYILIENLKNEDSKVLNPCIN